MAFWNREKKSKAGLDDEPRFNPFKLNANVDLISLINSKDVMVSFHQDYNAQYTYVNDHCRELLGYEPFELIGVPAYELIHPDDRMMIHDSHNWVLHGQDVNFSVYRLCRKDGEYIRCDSISWLANEGVIAVTQLHDVREIESSIVDMSKKMEKIIESLNDIKGE